MRAEEISGSREVVRPSSLASRTRAGNQSVDRRSGIGRIEDRVETSTLGKIIARLTRQLDLETRVRDERVQRVKSVSEPTKVDIPDNVIDKILSRMIES